MKKLIIIITILFLCGCGSIHRPKAIDLPKNSIVQIGFIGGEKLLVTNACYLINKTDSDFCVIYFVNTTTGKVECIKLNKNWIRIIVGKECKK